MRLTEEEYRALTGAAPKKSKYHNRKVEYYDPGLKETITFDSVKERDYYLLLKDRERRGEIIDLKRQVEIEIQPGFILPNGEKIRPITYRADFTYKTNPYGVIHIIDVKGSPNTLTEVYKLKKKLLAYKGYYIEEVY